MASSTPEEAVYARLDADGPLSDLIDHRIYPILATQEAQYPFVVYQRVGREDVRGLSGSRSLAAYAIRVDCYAATMDAAQDIWQAVHTALCPDGGWADAGESVQGVFGGDAAGDVTEDGIPFWSETFTVWFGSAG